MFAAYLVIGVFGFVAGLIVLLNKGNPLPAAIPRAASLNFIPSTVPCVANQYPQACDDEAGLKRRTGAYSDYLINPATGLTTLHGALDVAGNPLGADLSHSDIDSGHDFGHDFDHDFGMNHFGSDF
ncbi:hypothetical protein ACN2AK_22500 [Shewanella xiamenensis]|uniref:hypothetical protein n=1 Tax=Shewanella xiamenensis TaxID=332186 RepID=UPI002119D648|nr:hypothetical protein [Shewanella xiamenensis]